MSDGGTVHPKVTVTILNETVPIPASKISKDDVTSFHLSMKVFLISGRRPP